MPTDFAKIWFWLYPILILPSAIYYGIRIYRHRRHIKPTQNDKNTTNVRVDGLLRIEQRELGNSPPIILTIFSLLFAVLLLAFGIWVIYMWFVGIGKPQFDFATLFFFIFFIGLPLYILIDQFFIQPKYDKIGKSFVAKEARVFIANDPDTVFNACHRILEFMKATIVVMNKPKLLKATIRNSVLTIKIRRIKGSRVAVYVLSDSKWLTVRFDSGANQRNINTFLKELGK